jgi:hypothetical protein
MSIAHRLAYLQRVVPTSRELEGVLGRARAHLSAAAAAKVGVIDDIAGGDSDPDAWQALEAPLQHDGCGLAVGVRGSARAAYLASMALAQQAARTAPVQFRPFNGPLREGLAAEYGKVCDEMRAAGSELPALEQLDDSAAEQLTGLARLYNRAQAQSAYEQRLQRCTQTQAANLRSAATRGSVGVARGVARPPHAGARRCGVYQRH